MSIVPLYILPPSLEASVYQATLWVLGGLVVLLVALVGWAVFLRVRRARKRRHQRRLEAQWEPRLGGVLDGQAPPEFVHDAVAAGQGNALLTLLHRRAPDVSDENLDTLRTIARPYLVAEADPLSRRTAEQRAYHVHRFGWLGEQDLAEPVLRRALEDSSPFVAMVAARALIRRRTASTAQQAERAQLIVSALPRFKDWSQKSLAALLAQMDGVAAPLRRAFADPEVERRVRLIAAATLRELGDSEAAAIAVRLLEEDSPLPLQTASLRLLEVVGSDPHAPFLRLLSWSENEVIRIRALSALAHIGRATDVDRFEEGLNDPSRWVARQAALGLVRIGRPEPLLAMINTEHSRAALARQVLKHHRVAA